MNNNTEYVVCNTFFESVCYLDYTTDGTAWVDDIDNAYLFPTIDAADLAKRELKDKIHPHIHRSLVTTIAKSGGDNA